MMAPTAGVANDGQHQSMKGLRHGCPPVVAEVQRVHRLPRALLQRVEALFGPGGDVVQPMVALKRGDGSTKACSPIPGSGPPSCHRWENARPTGARAAFAP